MRDFEGLGEELKAALGSESEFRVHLKEALGGAVKPETVRRRDLLRSIPFHSVLTTNFDDILGRASIPGPATFAGALTAETRDWWHHEFWDHGAQAYWGKKRLVALHGQASAPSGELVFSTQSYRRLLHEMPAYRAFLRTLFATRNVLFLGFSFKDAYIDELRSEILAMIGMESATRRLTDYAILEDVPPALARHLEAREGLVPLNFSTVVKGEPKPDFTGFDRWLAAIHDATAPRESLRARLQGRRILWCDPARDRNEPGAEILRGAQSDGVFVKQVETVAQALAEVERSEAPYDLLVTRWGHRAPGESDALELLKRLAIGPRPPVVIFASGQQRKENRTLALRHGKLRWIRRQQAAFDRQARESEREMVSGESHYFLGRRYRLEVVPTTGRSAVVQRRKSTLELHVRPELTTAHRERVLQGWYRERLRELVAPLLEKWQAALGVIAEEWGIRKMKTKWGSCNAEARRIWLNPELIKKPPECLEYLVVHELVHLVVRHHDDRFHALMDRHLPRWRAVRRELNAAPLAKETWEC